MPYDDISLLPYGGTTGYLQPSGGGGGLFGSLFGGGQQQALPGLLNGGGNTDALINQLLQRQIEAATQPDWGAFSAALAKAAQPGPYPKSVGAALGEAAGALSGNREQSLARALQSAKLMQDLQLQRRKQNMFEQMFGSGAGNDPDISAAKDILSGAGIPGIKPLSSSSTATAKPRITGTDETTGDLSPSYGEVPTDATTTPGDAELSVGSPAPRPQAALPVARAAYAPGTAGQERFLDLTAQLESGNRNVMQGVVPAGGGYNPSVGRVTGPSTAQGFFQITNSTWRQFAPPEVQAQYPTAMSAPYEVQRAVARNILTEGGPQHWTNYNAPLARAASQEGLLGRLAGGSPLVNPDQSPTAAVRGGLPPQDEVIPSGRGSIPGLLRAQYTGQVNPDQSPSIQMGGQPMPAAPTPPPMAPGQPQPGVTAPTVPTPANMDPRQINQVLLNLARKSAMAEAAGFPNIYGPMISAIQQSPQYKAMQEYASKSATLPLEYLGPQYNPQVQGNLEAVRQTAIQLGKFLGPEYDPTIQKMLKDIDERAKAPYGTPVEQTIELPDGTQQKMKMTPAEFADYRAGKGIAGMPPGARIVGEPAGQTAETQKARLELDTLDAKTLREQATAGRKILPLLGEVTRLAYEAPGGLSGRASAELARLLPFPVPVGWTNAEVLGSLGQQFLPSVRAPGAQSNAEMTAGLQAVPGLMQSQGGRVKIAAINKAMIERTIEMADIYREHLGTAELHRKLAELDKKPLFSDEIRREIGFGGNQGSQPAGGAAPGSIKTPYGTISPVQ